MPAKMPDNADPNDGFGVLGKEGRFIAHGTQRGKGVAVFTSGGDAQGMNAAVRACVRMGLYLGATVYFIREGYQGMVDGEEFIVKTDWSSVSGIIHRGGTVIGSARCKEFRERSGRLKAAKNLINKGITNLVCIGGDGSLTGANQFRQEWPSLVEELFKNGEIDEIQKGACQQLNIVGLVGSIDNDFCGTDMTIGTDSALHRIIESIDVIVATASSHQRTFIMEVMGRHCGYLALVAAIATEADYVFIPEWPPEPDWPETLCRKLTHSRKMGQRLNIIIVAEGAIDRDNKAITCEQIKKIVHEKLQQDTRITVLGHIQRGGAPSAFDRILGTRMGAEAVLALFDAKPDTEAMVVTLDGNQAVRVPLMYCVEKTKAVGKALSERQWERAIELRGKSFARNLETYRLLARIKPPERATAEGGYKWGVMHVGTPTGGMNACVRSVVRNAQYRGDIVYGIHDGFDGFVTENFHVINWADVNGWLGEGGAFLGSTRTLPDKFLGKIATNIKKFGLNGIIVIGGFEAYKSIQILADNRSKYAEFKIPLVVVPATVSNNVPGTDLTVGCDTALNEICKLCDIIRMSAQGVKRRVFVIETAGTSGYLCTMAALASGADAAYIMEEPIRIRDLQQDVMHLATKMNDGVMCGFVLRNHNANHQYNTDFLFRLYTEEGKNIFTTRMNVFGHLQSGGSPSPFDRNMGTKMGAKAIGWLSRKVEEVKKGGVIMADQPNSAILIGVTKRRWVFTPVQELKEITDYSNRLPRQQWWMKLRPLLRIMAKHNAIFEEEVETLNAATDDNLSDIGSIGSF